MDDIYGDLENFNDVNLVNELKTENAGLKHKLDEVISSKESLQTKFDKLSSEFKILTTNYTSLLQVSRAEIKRKSDMITLLNNEKDALVINRFNAGGRGRRKNYPNMPIGRNQVNEFNRNECQGPPSETSSTDQSHKLSIVENRSVDNLNLLDKNASKVNEAQKYDAFPNRPPPIDYRDDRPQGACGIDKRLSLLAGQQFAKFSSDEEFEDMYSALEPKNKTSFRDDPERGRKRNRDEPQQCRAYYDAFAPLSRYPSNPESSRERFDKNRNSRYYDNDKNRDKYDFPPQPHRNKISPDRHRRSKIEYGEDRYSQRYDRHRQLETPPERRYQHKSRERRPYHEKDRVDYQNDIHRYNSADHHKPSIHDEYDEPQIKRPRVESYPNPDEERRLNDKFSNEHPSTDMLDGGSCQSPDNMHTEHAAFNEPIREIKHTAVTELDDPRVTSRKYVKLTDRNKDIICSVSSNEIDLQPVNKSLWELKKEKIPHALALKPVEISEELATCEIYMDIDKPIADLGAEPTNVKEIKNNREVTEYDLEKDTEGKNVLHCTRNENIKDMFVSKQTKGKNKEGEKLNKTVKCKISKNQLKGVNKQNRVVNSSEVISNKSDKVDTNKGNDEKVGTLGFLNKLSSVSECNPILEVVKTTESAKLTDNKDLRSFPDTLITEHGKSCKNETETRVTIQREFEHKVYSIRHIVEGDLELSDETNDDTHVQAHIHEQADTHRKHKTKQKPKKDTPKEKVFDLETNTRKTRPQKDKVKDEKSKNKFCELFGENSSLITPEDLALATTQAHAAARGETYVPVCENAQDGINNKEKLMEPLTQTTQNVILKSDESKVSEKNNSTETTKDIEDKVTEHVNTSYRSAKPLCQLMSNNSYHQTDHKISKNIGENTLCRSEKIHINIVKKPQDDEKTIKLTKRVQAVKTTPDETTSKSIKKTHNDDKPYKSVKNAQVDEKLGKSVKKTQDEEKASKYVKKTQDNEKESKSGNNNQDEKTSKSVKKTLSDIKTCKYVNKNQDNEKESVSVKKTQVEKNSKSVKKKQDNEKATKSVKKTQDEKTSNLFKKTQNDENTSKHTKKTRGDKITIDTDTSNKESKTNEENVIPANEENAIPANEEKVIPANEENVIPANEENVIPANEENAIPANEIVVDSKIDRNRSIYESKRHIHRSCNKENTAFTDLQDMNNDMPKVFDDTLVPSKNDVNSYIAHDEKIMANTKLKENICGTRIEEIPNLAPVIDDPGVQIVVISSGIQPSDSNLLQLNSKQCYSTPLKALATSTPAKEMAAQNPFSEIELNGHLAGSVNIKPPNEDSSQCEPDVPDVRINFYRRRKKVKKIG